MLTSLAPDAKDGKGFMDFVRRFFRLQAHGVTVRSELAAGAATFAAMAYILAVNPEILGHAGMDRGAVLAATALASALFTAAMGLYANLPVALAPGMGMNAYFAFGLCVAGGLHWQQALGIVFWSGAFFLVVALSGLRQAVLDAVPAPLRAAIACGVGAFIAFIGLQKAGLVVAAPATLVGLGNLAAPGPLLALGGLLLAVVLMRARVPGAVLWTVVAVTALGLVVRGPDGRPLTAWPREWLAAPPNPGRIAGELDLLYPLKHFGQCVPWLFTVFFIDLFDGMGTLLGLIRRLERKAPAADPRFERALRADACATMGCALLGTSTVTPYIESAAGIESGGRTGLAALATAGCFLLALLAAPLFLAVPAVATAPVLILVGVLMMEGIGQIDFADLGDAVPALLIVLLMPLTFSIAEGIAVGFLAYVVLRAATGRAREIPAALWGITVLLVLHFAWRMA